MASVVTAFDDDLLFSGDEVTDDLVNRDDMWLVDTGASAHVSNDRAQFSTYTSRDCGMLRMGNGRVCMAIGVDDVHLKMSTDFVLELKDVRHVTDIRFSLFYVGRFDRWLC
ncbi:hypothetical protein KSP39_PZI010981 [Platanthera zijinensis]|uniref:Retrovirus-related Pol polyprotein from transposon TNT 1-94-like beta-barrel domain-containing protein n=1 Tax=Platanthera zijinensis TaxID=2320716 RepID=A0AAP0G5A4_9ASPA